MEFCLKWVVESLHAQCLKLRRKTLLEYIRALPSNGEPQRFKLAVCVVAEQYFIDKLHSFGPSFGPLRSVPTLRHIELLQLSLVRRATAIYEQFIKASRLAAPPPCALSPLDILNTSGSDQTLICTVAEEQAREALLGRWFLTRFTYLRSRKPHYTLYAVPLRSFWHCMCASIRALLDCTVDFHFSGLYGFVYRIITQQTRRKRV